MTTKELTNSITAVPSMIPQGEAIAILPTRDGKGKPITVIGTQKIRDEMDVKCLEQVLNARSSPGVEDVVLGADAHPGYGAPIGCVMTSATHIYPGPVGVDIKCSMSLLQLDLPESEIKEKPVRRALIDAITARIPTGAGQGQRSVPKSRRAPQELLHDAAAEGASEKVCKGLGVPPEWADRCEDSHHLGAADCVSDGGHQAVKIGKEFVAPRALLDRLLQVIGAGIIRNPQDKFMQLGSYGTGNHFGECEIVHVAEGEEKTAQAFNLLDGRVAFLSHCGSRGLGNILATNQFKSLQEFFQFWGIPFPGGDKELIYAPLGSPEAEAYLNDMALGANFATVNHMLINSLVLEAFQEVFPGVKGNLVYVISHNIARKEVLNNHPTWVHRKGATRAFPAGHFALKGTPFYETGHPILLPGNPVSGSYVMVAEPGAEKSCYSINHGAGRAMGRKAAIRYLDQGKIDRQFEDADILTNCRQYPKDEAPRAYKDFEEVVKSVRMAGLAKPVASLQARFVIKDGDKADD